jgi:hypothetical protein
MVFVRRGLFGHAEPSILVTGPVLAESEAEARAALAILDTCPALGRALRREVNVPIEFDALMQGTEDFYPEGLSYAADNMWTDAPVEKLLPGIQAIARTLPESPSHMMWMQWGPPEPRPDMAFSLEADIYIALYAAWPGHDDDSRHQAWVTDHMRELEPLSLGIQLADENLAARPARFMADANAEKLQTIRRKWDPDGLFHSFMRTASR